MNTNDELNEFDNAIFTGIIVGVGSLVLLFSSETRIILQCPFKCGEKDHFQTGHGEDLLTSNYLFPLLNQRVESCSVQNGEILNLCFDNKKEIYIFPERTGFESYVITTSQGNYPVIVT